MAKIQLQTKFAGLTGKVALITGANSGIGKVTAIDLALQGYHVILACRDADKAQAVINHIAQLSHGQAKTTFIPVELGDFASVRACAERFLQMNIALDVLINNAGVAGAKGKTASGFELTFGVCHMGHFLLTALLLPALKLAPAARVVVVASKAHGWASGINFAQLNRSSASFFALKEYAVAKLANVLFASELARQLSNTNITTYSLHPGEVMTHVWRHVPKVVMAVIGKFLITEQQGALTSIYCATSSEVAAETGLYYVNCSAKWPSKTAQNLALAAQLWQFSETSLN